MAYYSIKVKEQEKDGRCYVAEVMEDGHLKMTGDPGYSIVLWHPADIEATITYIKELRDKNGLPPLTLTAVAVNPS